MSRTTHMILSHSLVAILQQWALAQLSPPPDSIDPQAVTPQEHSASTNELTPSQLFEQASPAVYKLVLLDDDHKEIGLASAFAVKAGPQGPDGSDVALVTNYHAIRGAPNARAESSDGRTGKVSLVLAEDESVDLAIILARFPAGLSSMLYFDKTSNHVRIEEYNGDNNPLRTLHFDKTSNCPVGSRIFVIGSPKGLTNTLSEGLVSGYRKRDNGKEWIQLTAPISPGSSGGPVLTSGGQLIGVATASLVDGQNLNFAAPASEIRNLLSANTGGRGRWLWKGASISKAREEAFKIAELELYRQLDLYEIGRAAQLGLQGPIRLLVPADALHLQTEPPEYWIAQAWFRDMETHEQILGDFFEEILSEKIRHRDETPESSAPCYRQFLDLRADAGDQLALILKGHGQYEQKKYEEAAQTLTLATKAKPGEFAYLAHFTLAEAQYVIELAWANKHSGYDPNARAFLDPTVFSKTISALLDAKKANPTFEPTLDLLTDCYLKTKQYPDALVSAEFLVQAAPNCSSAYQTRGYVNQQLERYQAARRDFFGAVELNPNNYLALDALAGAYSSLGEHDNAIHEYQELLARDSPIPPEFLHWNIANGFAKMSNWEQAIAAGERAIQLFRRKDDLFSKNQIPWIEAELSRWRAHVK